MEFNAEYQYQAPIDTVWNMFADPNYAIIRAKKLEMTDPKVEAHHTDQQTTSTTTGGVPTDMLPDMAKRFISPSTKAEFVEQWTRAGADKINGTIEVTAKGVPASLKASAILTANGDVTDVKMSGDVKVSIPFIGKRVEAEAVKFAPEIVKGEQETSAEYLATKQ